MSEDEARRAQNEEQGDEADVEAHRRTAGVNDEGQAEGDDDVEAHMRRSAAKKL